MKTSQAQKEERADREGASAKKSGAPPPSQPILMQQSLSEHSAMVLSMSQLAFREDRSTQDTQLDKMESGLLPKPAQKHRGEELVRVESDRPRQPMQAVRPRQCLPVEGTGGDEMGVLGEGLVVAGYGASVEDQRAPFWKDSKNVLEWLLLIAERAEQEDSSARLDFPFDDGGGVWSGGRLVLEDGEQAPPGLLQQQQELPPPPPEEPWPPPKMAAEHGRGAGSSGKSRLERGRKDIFGNGGVLSNVHGFWESKESRGKGDEGGDATDGSAWERAGIGTNRSYSSTYVRSGCEVAGRRLTRQRRARVRVK